MAEVLRSLFRLRPSQRVQWPVLAALLGGVLLADGCAASGPRSADEPYKPYWERTQTHVRGELTVSVAVPTAAEAVAIYGVDLAGKNIQPVWLEVRNTSTVPYWFLFSGLDPNYYSAAEVAYAFPAASADGPSKPRFAGLQFRNPILPGSTVSGFVLTNRDEGFKAVEVDLVSERDAKSVTAFVVDPTFKRTATLVDFDTLYGDDALVHVDDEEALRALLEQLPCCVTNADGAAEGDPLNLVLIGSRTEFGAAMLRRRWHPTEVLSLGSLWRTVSAFVTGSRYRYAPVSPLYVYGRAQDIAAQKARATIHERNHARFWLTPIRFRGEEVWVGQISRDIGVKFTLKSPTISTHVIDPDVDEARRYMLEDLGYSQGLAKFGFVKGVGATPKDAPRLNLVGDPWYSDGLRAVMVFGQRPYALGDIEIIDWERPSRQRAVAEGTIVAGDGGDGQR